MRLVSSIITFHYMIAAIEAMQLQRVARTEIALKLYARVWTIDLSLLRNIYVYIALCPRAVTAAALSRCTFFSFTFFFIFFSLSLFYDA